MLINVIQLILNPGRFAIWMGNVQRPDPRLFSFDIVLILTGLYPATEGYLPVPVLHVINHGSDSVRR